MRIRMNSLKQVHNNPIESYFLKLSGYDTALAAQCGYGLRKAMVYLSFLAPLFFLLFWAVGAISLSHLFKNTILAFVLAGFIAWLIFNLYRLMLITLNQLPLHTSKKPIRHKLSLIIRMIFISCLSLILSVPLSAIVYKKALNNRIETHRTLLKISAISKLNYIYKKRQLHLQQLFNKTHLDHHIITQNELVKKNTLHHIYNNLNQTDFFMKRIQVVLIDYPVSWAVILSFILLMNIPALYGMFQRKNQYMELKKHLERTITDTQYIRFKEAYSNLFYKQYGVSKQYYESYIDPPYNSIAKTDQRIICSETEFIDNLYHA